MLYIIITILVFIIFILLKNGRSINFTQQEKELMERLHQKEIQGLTQIENKVNQAKIQAEEDIKKIDKELIIRQEALINSKNTEIEKIKQEAKLLYEQELNSIKQKIITLDFLEQQKLKTIFCEYQDQHDKKINELKIKINQTNEELDSLIAKRQNTIAIIKEEEKIKNEKDFYRIILSQDDSDDIFQLKQVEKRLNNKDVLRKLIYKTYIEIPMNNLFNRVGIKECAGIYKISNLNNNMVYIGQSTNVRNRIKSHIQASLGISTIASQLVHDKMAEEGLENFSFQIVEECDRTQLNDREKYYINYYKSNDWGYNKTSGGARS